MDEALCHYIEVRPASFFGSKSMTSTLKKDGIQGWEKSAFGDGTLRYDLEVSRACIHGFAFGMVERSDGAVWVLGSQTVHHPTLLETFFLRLFFRSLFLG